MRRPLLRRRTWRERRKHLGRRRPRPLNVAAGNCMSVSTGPDHAAAIFRAYLHTGADVLLLSECADFDAAVVAEATSPGVWCVYQPGPVGSPESGAVVVWRRSRGRDLTHRLGLGSKATSEGGGIRDRPIAQVRLRIDGRSVWQWDRWFSAGHAPPPRAPRARAAFMARFARVWGVSGGDLNLPARAVARVTGRRVRGFGVLHVVTPWWVPVGGVRRIPKAQLAGADHDGVLATLWPKR